MGRSLTENEHFLGFFTFGIIMPLAGCLTLLWPYRPRGRGQTWMLLLVGQSSQTDLVWRRVQWSKNGNRVQSKAQGTRTNAMRGHAFLAGVGLVTAGPNDGR